MSFIHSSKLQNHLNRLVDWRAGSPVLPVTVELHLSSICNQKCFYCCCMAHIDEATMPSARITKAVDRLVSIGTMGLIFSGGGEPLVNKQAAMALEYARGSGLDVGLITNGSLIDEKITDAILKNCDWVRISLDAHTRELYKNIRGADHFDRVVKNIKLLLSKRKELGSKTTIGVQFVLNERNKDHAVHFYNFCMKEFSEVDYVQIRPLDIMDHAYFDTTQLANIKLLCSNKLILSDKFYVEQNEKPKCLGHQFIGAVDVFGEVALCCNTMPHQWSKYANVFNDADWEDNAWITARDKAFNNIDYDACPYGCRAFGINRYLESLTKPQPHRNFL